MGLNKVRIGDCVELYSEACGIPNLTIYDISGVNREKEFFSPSKSVGEDTSKYKIVPPGYFACNLMHVGRDVVLPIALNTTEQNIIVTAAYSVFKLIDETKIIKEYFLMFCKSPEKDRNFWFHTDSSVRDGMSWKDFCDITIELPPIQIQRKFVAVYKSMVENQKAYEQGLEDLKTTCFGFIEELKRNSELKPIGNYITPYNEKNFDGKITLEQGINIDKRFITPQRSNSNLEGRKIVRKGQFAYCTQLNNENVAIAYRTDEDCVVSSVYDVFEIDDTTELVPEYLMLWLIRPEFGRFVYWASEGSAYEFLNYRNLANYEIPIPSYEIQKSVGEVYSTYVMRREINDELKALIKDICPILIKGSLEEARA